MPVQTRITPLRQIGGATLSGCLYAVMPVADDLARGGLHIGAAHQRAAVVRDARAAVCPIKHAYGAMGRRFEGTQHSALADAINTSAVLTLMQDDEKFRETMRPVLEILEPSEGLSDAIGDLFPDLENLKNNL